MAVKHRIVVCDCGENFIEKQENMLDGNIGHTSWKYVKTRIRTSKTNEGSDIVVLDFDRNIICAGCKGQIMTEKKEFELSPSAKYDDKDYAKIQMARELIMSAPT